jgi:adenine phosphoribosyltransferase
MTEDQLKGVIREVPDFPKPGINFYDVSTLFRSPDALRSVVKQMADRFRDQKIDVIAGIEARGFVLGSAIACELGLGFILVRKFGKLPGETEGETYDLEYGTAHIEMHRDAVGHGERVVIVDDLLATGGTAAATGNLIRRLGGAVASYAFMVELDFLKGRERLKGDDVFSLIHYA